MQFKILFLGEHDNHISDSEIRIYPLTSAVAILFDGVQNVLFDTGSLAWQKQLLSGLIELGLSPDDITDVCLTHFHLDHTANSVLFENAKIHAAKSTVDHKTGACTIYPNSDKRVLPHNIKVLPTPGHTPDHISYLFEHDGIKYCFAGDAIREDLILAGPPDYMDLVRRNDFVQSQLNIFNNCEVIIPGHFGLIEGAKKAELFKKIM